MTDTDHDELVDRLRRSLHAKAELTPRVVGRRHRASRRHRGWLPFAAVGVVAAGIAGTAIVTTRSDDPVNVTPSATSSVDGVPASTGVLLSPPPDTPGLRIGTGSNLQPLPGGGYTTGAVSAPSGLVAIVQNDPGEFPRSVPHPSAETLQLDGRRVLTWQNPVRDVRTYAMESSCSNTSIAAISPDEAWTGELRTLLDATTIDPNGSMNVELPEGWTSFGGGRLGPGYQYRFLISVDGAPTEFTVLQRFDTSIGATVRDHEAAEVTVNDAPALIYGEGDLVVTFAAGPDAVSLHGSVDAETLVEIAESLDRYDLTVDLDEARNLYPTIETTTCDRLISITP